MAAGASSSVDDDPALRHAITSFLDRAGYHAAQAGDGAEALRKLQQEPFDLLLLDIGLPGINGLDVLAQARTYPSPPRVVMMTADDTPETLLRSFREQARAFVRKPFTPRRIVELVNDVLAASPTATLPIEMISLAHDRGARGPGLRPGGFGLALTRAMVDDVIYNEKRNEVVLVKYLD